jgi:hypothetical protein
LRTFFAPKALRTSVSLMKGSAISVFSEQQ